VPSALYHVSHVVGLGSAFEMVRVDAGAVVAFVADYRGPVKVGEVVGYAVCCTVFAEDVELTVGVASA